MDIYFKLLGSHISKNSNLMDDGVHGLFLNNLRPQGFSFFFTAVTLKSDKSAWSLSPSAVFLGSFHVRVMRPFSFTPLSTVLFPMVVKAARLPRRSQLTLSCHVAFTAEGGESVTADLRRCEQINGSVVCCPSFFPVETSSMAWTNYQLFLAGLMLTTGSINTLSAKWVTSLFQLVTCLCYHNIE